MRFMAIASVSCASLLIEPNDIAPVANRFTISAAGSTSSSGTGGSGRLEIEHAAQHQQVAILLVHDFRELLESLDLRLPHGVLQLAHRHRIQQVPLAAHAILIFAADAQLGVRLARMAASRIGASSALRAPALPCPRPRCARTCR